MAMEVCLRECKGVPEGSVLQVRSGNVVKLHRHMQSEKPLKLPAEMFQRAEGGHQTVIEVDVLISLGRSKISIAPGTDKLGFNIHSTCEARKVSCEVQLQRVADEIITPKVSGKRSHSKGTGEKTANHQSKQSRHVNAMKYMNDHQLLEAMNVALHTTVQNRPDDPIMYMAEKLIEAGKTLKIAKESDLYMEKPQNEKNANVKLPPPLPVQPTPEPSELIAPPIPTAEERASTLDLAEVTMPKGVPSAGPPIVTQRHDSVDSAESTMPKGALSVGPPIVMQRPDSDYHASNATMDQLLLEDPDEMMLQSALHHSANEVMRHCQDKLKENAQVTQKARSDSASRIEAEHGPPIVRQRADSIPHSSVVLDDPDEMSKTAAIKDHLENSMQHCKDAAVESCGPPILPQRPLSDHSASIAATDITEVQFKTLAVKDHVAQSVQQLKDKFRNEEPLPKQGLKDGSDERSQTIPTIPPIGLQKDQSEPSAARTSPSLPDNIHNKAADSSSQVSQAPEKQELQPRFHERAPPSSIESAGDIDGETEADLMAEDAAGQELDKICSRVSQNLGCGETGGDNRSPRIPSQRKPPLVPSVPNTKISTLSGPPEIRPRPPSDHSNITEDQKDLGDNLDTARMKAIDEEVKQQTETLAHLFTATCDKVLQSALQPSPTESIASAFSTGPRQQSKDLAAVYAEGGKEKAGPIEIQVRAPSDAGGSSITVDQQSIGDPFDSTRIAAIDAEIKIGLEQAPQLANLLIDTQDKVEPVLADLEPFKIPARTQSMASGSTIDQSLSGRSDIQATIAAVHDVVEVEVQELGRQVGAY